MLIAGYHQDCRPDILQQHHRVVPLQQQDKDHRGSGVGSQHSAPVPAEQQDIKNVGAAKPEEVEEALLDKEQDPGLGGTDGEQAVGGEDDE